MYFPSSQLILVSLLSFIPFWRNVNCAPTLSPTSSPGSFSRSISTLRRNEIPNVITRISSEGDRNGEEEIRRKIDLNQQIVDNGIFNDEYMTRPTRYESTVLGRRLLALSSTGVLATIFPDNTSTSSSSVPDGLSHTPIGLPDYLASCEEPSGNPTLLALTVSTSTRNAMAGSNVSLSVSWWDEYRRVTNREPWSRANLPRLSMIGYLEEISQKEVEQKGIVSCFTKIHHDSRLWLPGDKNAAHTGLWMRLVVREVYWVGGFGDRNFIGWFDIENDWKSISVDEWMSVRLPGES